MAEQLNMVTPFLLQRATAGTWRPLKNLLFDGAERLTGLKRCQQVYSQIRSDGTLEDFCRQALEKMGVSYQVSEQRLQRVPARGACVLVANHPYGGMEGVVLFHLLSRIRPDFKIMGNYLLGRVPQLREHLIEVDPFGRADSAQTNIYPLRQALQHLRQGGLLVIFPAGEVSSWKSLRDGVVDRQWQVNVARLVRKSKAPVVPVYFPGHNGPLFQLAGMVHPLLRTFMLPRMLLRNEHQQLQPLIGNPIAAKKWPAFATDQDLSDYLRLRTYALAMERKKGKKGQPQELEEKALAALLPQVDVHVLEREIANLPVSQHLVDSGEFSVYYGHAPQLPQLLQEIGRLRELTFRAVGEGSGKACDIDKFDADYLHLFVWNREERELVGAYRIGQVDKLLQRHGREGLYTATLFRFKEPLLEQLHHGLEMGRSFVRTEYQRSFAPLLLLWKGIGHYLVKHPHYRYLFGPVSISRDYSDPSRKLMTSVLSRHYLIQELAHLVAPRLPVPVKPLQISGIKPGTCDCFLQDVDDISALVADLEADNKGIPVLLRHYLGLGGKLLAFNLDPEFSDVIDGLLLVDLPQADKKQLQRYMGRDGYQHYVNSQAQLVAA